MSPKPRKRFGQNFLEDEAVIDRIVDSFDPLEGDTVIEIGPGRGALTRPLLDSGCALHVVELDRDLAAYWRQQLYPNLRVHESDALKLDFRTIEPKPLRLIGNLPYNISTPLLFHFLDHKTCFTDVHVMLQKEVAERICAAPGSKAYGRLGVMLAADFVSDVLFDVPPDAFYPEPKVTSSVIRMVPQESPFELLSAGLFAQLVKQAFSMRRKTLRKSLQSLCSDEVFTACEIDSGLRPEVLAPEQFALLSNYLHEHPKNRA